MKPAPFKFRKMIILLAIIVSGCSPSKPPTEPDLEKNIKHLTKWGRIYWDQRSSPEKARLASSFLGKAVSINTLDYDLAVLYSRACHYQGEYLEDDPSGKDSLFTAGMIAAYLAIQSTLNVQGKAEDGLAPENIIALLPDISGETTPALYWWTANFGRIMIKKPILERLKYQEAFEAVLYKLTSLDPNYYFGGPNRILGVFYSRIPGADLDLARTNFEQSIQIFPNYFATKVLMAEYYHVKTGNREKFHELLEEVIHDDATALPAAMAENLNEQNKARALLEMEASLFE